jgi:hypothetical protein
MGTKQWSRLVNIVSPGGSTTLDMVELGFCMMSAGFEWFPWFGGVARGYYGSQFYDLHMAGVDGGTR